jgi:hypothetical protein
VAREAAVQFVWIAGAVLLTAAATGVVAHSRRSSTRAAVQETRRVRDLYDRGAARYDRFIRIPERVLLEHVRSPRPLVRALQRLLEPLAIWCAGDHLLRDPLDHLDDIRFDVELCARSRAGLVERVTARKHTPISGEPLRRSRETR